jgi:hypothetical protein
MEIKELLNQKTLGLYDFGSVTEVKPTGRFIDALDTEKPDYFEPRHRFVVEVKKGFFGSAKWVLACNLKVIKEKQ